MRNASQSSVRPINLLDATYRMIYTQEHRYEQNILLHQMDFLTQGHVTVSPRQKVLLRVKKSP